jgi:asparagine synthase (glutamine-hydrolysing)
MCRIAGIINPQLSPEALQLSVRRMCHLQQHGGPDDEGIYSQPASSLVFGHRRLSLIDLSPGGHQPMFYQEEQLVISYNGELYNYLELKESLLAAGFRFSSQSDTEVILAAYAAWGTAAFKRFAGMFAFALFDRQQQAVYLVRDQTGIKPLYYSTTNGSLQFASEVRAFEHDLTRREANPHWPVYFLAYGHLPEPITTLKDVKPLQKGSYLRYHLPTQAAEVHSYAHVSFLEKEEDRTAALHKLRESLQVAVRRHLLSDAPIGAFLSGGIDSSLLALLAGQEVKDRLTTLSIYFSERTYSEKQYQDLIAEKLNGHHRAFCLQQAEFDNLFPQIIGAMDMPSNDGINTWFISKYAKEAGLKAVLSGLGGDELFGGYPSFERIQTAHYLQKMPAATLRAGRFGPGKKAKRLAYLSLPGIKGKYLFLRGQFVPSEIARQLDAPEEQVWRLLEEQPVLPPTGHLSLKNQASWLEFHLYMQNQLLRDSDVMSMAHGIEIRVPFLDLDFVKFAFQLSTPVKYAGAGKQLLIDAFHDVLPNAIYNRRKMGFSFPFKEWLASNEWVRGEMASASGATAKVYREFLQGQRHWSQLLSILLIRQRHAQKKAALSYA